MNNFKLHDDAFSVLNTAALPKSETMLSMSSYTELKSAIDDRKISGQMLITVCVASVISLYAKSFTENDITKFKLAMNRLIGRYKFERKRYFFLNKVIEQYLQEMNSTDLNYLKDYCIKRVYSLINDITAKENRIIEQSDWMINDNDAILTFSNFGLLTSPANGMFNSILSRAVEAGKKFTVYVCETRPSLSGSRLTVYELNKRNFETTLIPDSYAINLFCQKKINKVFCGADTYSNDKNIIADAGALNLSFLAKQFHVPFYAFCTTECFAENFTYNENSPRYSDDLTQIAFWGFEQIVNIGVKIINQTNEFVPATNITGIMTDSGLLKVE